MVIRVEWFILWIYLYIYLYIALHSPKGGIGLVRIKVLYPKLQTYNKLSKTWTKTTKLYNLYRSDYNDNDYSISYN